MKELSRASLSIAIMMLYLVLFLHLGASAETNDNAKFQFKHHFADADMGPGSGWAQAALVDIDQDGDLDFVVGDRDKPLRPIYWYEFRGADDWVRHLLGRDSPPDVGGALLDVNGDGWIDHVTGKAWYENSGDPRKDEFRRHVFDESLADVHDIVIGDINGDGVPDVVTLSDKNDLRWYQIADDPEKPWQWHHIFESVHSGISLGDLDGDGDTDIVRSDIWLENLGKGQSWESHRLTPPWGNRSSAWSYNATQTEIADIDGDGRADIVICDGEISGARIAWLRSPEDPRHDRWPLNYLPTADSDERGAYHTLQIGDLDADGDLDVFSAEMEAVAGARPPRWFIWENADGKGEFIEHVILDVNLGGHLAQLGDVDADGDLDICSKPWRAAKSNGADGKNHFDFLENLQNSPR